MRSKSENDPNDLIGEPPTAAPSSSVPVARDDLGRFPKGVSGNPTGRPRDTIAKLARERGPEALAVLTEIMLDKAAFPKDRMAAAEAVLSRGFGRPVQPMADTDAEGNDKPASSGPSEAALAVFGRLVEKLDVPRWRAEVIDVTPRPKYPPEMLEVARRIAYLGYLDRKKRQQAEQEHDRDDEKDPVQVAPGDHQRVRGDHE